MLKVQRIDRLGPREQPEWLVLLCHGFGAPGDDLVSLGEAMLELREGWDQRVRFLFPEAPLDLADEGMPGGRAWWMIDVLRLQTKPQHAVARDLPNESPANLPVCRQLLKELVAAELKASGLDASRLILGGFSQGAMVTSDLALHLDDCPAGLVVLSGALINQAEWQQTSTSNPRVGLPVFQSHGRRDPILPFENAELLADFWTQQQAVLSFHPFGGYHEIPRPIFMELIQWLEARMGTM